MKISVNDVELYTLTDIQKKVIQDEISTDIFDEDMKRCLQWVLMHRYERCFAHLKNEWDQKLPSLGVTEVPTDPDAYAELIFSLPEYKDRKARDDAASLE